MKWFCCYLPEDDLHSVEFHVNFDMSIVRRTDRETGKKQYAGLFLMDSGVYKRTKYSDSMCGVENLTFRHAHVKLAPTRQKRLHDLRFEIPLLLA